MLALLPVVATAAAGCESQTAAPRPASAPSRPTVSDSGVTITFPPASPALAKFATVVVRRGETVVTRSAPARVVASLAPSVGGTGGVVLFESPDAGAAWAQYQQARAGVARAGTARARVREMYTNLGATAREVADAEADLATARAGLAQYETQLRALGFDPARLGAARGAVAWLMADVPESELREVRQSARVTAQFAAFPNDSVVARAEVVGDNVDPATRTVKVRVVIPNPARRLLPGMYARVSFGDPRRAVLMLPASSVVTVEERDYVFVRTAPAQFARREVTVQRGDADSVIVLAGLAGGDQVATTGAMLLKGLSFGY